MSRGEQLMRNVFWKFLPIVLLIAPQPLFAGVVVEPTSSSADAAVQSTSSSEFETLIKQLNENLCANPTQNDKVLRMPPLESKASGDSPPAKDTPNPSKLEAGACAECDVKSATAATKLSSVEEASAPIGKVIESALERERIKREVAYFEFVSGSDGATSPSALKEQIDAYKSSKQAMEKKLAKCEAKLQSLEKMIDKLVLAKEKKYECTYEDRKRLREFIGPRIASLQNVVDSYGQKISIYKKTVEDASFSEAAKATAKSNLSLYDGTHKKRSLELNSLRELESWAKGESESSLLPEAGAAVVMPWMESESIQHKNCVEQSKTALKDYENTIHQYEVKLTEAEKAASVSKSELSDEDLVSRLREFEKKFAYKASYMNPVFKPCGMSEAEIHAVRKYTGDGYSQLNKALRSTGEGRERYAAFEQVLNAALDKVRSYEGTVKRGGMLPKPVLDQHQVGDIVTYAAFTSSSVKGGFPSDHKFVIKSKTGKYIAPYSDSYTEYEVLFKSNTKFKILSRKDNDGSIDFVLEEVTE